MIPLLVLVAVLVLGGFGYWVHASTSGGSSASNVRDLQVRDGVDPKEVQNIISRVGKLVVVKEGELPTVATIQDISILLPQNPTLYRDAENGDKLLVWSDKIVVYSASKDRVLFAMPINVTAPEAQATSDSTVMAANAPSDEKASIEVRNGTQTAGLARVLSDSLKVEGFTMTAPGDAKNKSYSKTVIFNGSGKSLPKTLEALVKSTGGSVVDNLPDEAKSVADILVIIGK